MLPLLCGLLFLFFNFFLLFSFAHNIFSQLVSRIEQYYNHKPGLIKALHVVDFEIT